MAKVKMNNGIMASPPPAENLTPDVTTPTIEIIVAESHNLSTSSSLRFGGKESALDFSSMIAPFARDLVAIFKQFNQFARQFTRVVNISLNRYSLEVNFRYAAIVFLSCTTYASVLRAQSLKSYSSPEMGISFSYPEDWTVRLSTGSLHSSHPPHITLTHPEKEHYVSGDIMPVTVVFISVEKRGNQSLEQWAAKDASLFDEKSLQPLQARSQMRRRKVAGFTALDRCMEASRAGGSWEPAHRKLYIERQDLLYTIFGVNQFLGSERFNKFFETILNFWQFL